MDTMIHIQMMTGPQAGLVNALSQTQITFGRAPDNHLVIDDSHLSRHHGGLQYSDGQWHLINNSPNGTTVNGRKIKHNRPVPIQAGDQVGVGKVRLFAIQFEPPANPADLGAAMTDPAAAQRAAADQQPGAGRRNKLWVGIGVYLFIFLVIFVVLAMVGRPTKPPPEAAERVTDDQIKAEIIRSLKRTPDEREAEKHLIDAQRWYGRAKTLSTPAALYQAHRHYKLALAFADKSTLEGLH
ncbi:MAG: FHA domain-containing protein, partial [Phycisphaerae bacterium]|nr:FHA domain-containing protein [Phycisphaerae bacterium]